MNKFGRRNTVYEYVLSTEYGKRICLVNGLRYNYDEYAWITEYDTLIICSKEHST
jgi:gamma-glutamylcysteine synthetase